MAAADDNKINLNELDPELGKIISWTSKNSILRIIYSPAKSPRIELHPNYLMNKSKLKELDNLSIKIIEKIINILYYRILKKNYLTFKDTNQIYWIVNNPSFEKENSTPNSTSSTQKNINDPVTQNNDDIDSVFLDSHDDQHDLSKGRLKTPVERWNQLIKYLQSKQLDYCVWISEIRRDHNIMAQSKLDPNESLFKTITNHFNPQFGDFGNVPCMIVPKTKGYCYALNINKTGYINIYIDSYVNWGLLIKHLNTEFSFLSELEFEEFLDSFDYGKDKDKKKLFILETANRIGPVPLVEENFKGSCIICKKLFYRGTLHDVQIKIDNSKGFPEIEFIGAEGPCRRLQELISRPLQIAESMAYMEYAIEEIFMTINLSILNQDEIIESFKESQATLKNIETKIDINQKRIEDKIDINQNENREFYNQSIQQGTLLIQSMEKQTSVFNSQFETNIAAIENVNNNIAWFGEEQQRTIINTKQEIIKKIDEKFDELKTLIEEKILSQNEQFKNNLYLILRALEKLPYSTVDMLVKELNIAKSTLYRNLNLLQEKNIIKKKKIKKNNKGRPNSVFEVDLCLIMKKPKKK